MSLLARSCLAAVSLAAPLLSSKCDEYLFDEQEIRIRHDAGHDTLDVLLIEHGIAAVDGADHLERARQDFTKFAQARGAIGPIGIEWPLNLALDLDAEPSVTDETSAESKAGIADWKQIRPSFAVVEKGLFLDELRRLSAWSHVRVSHVKEVTAIANRMFARTTAADATRRLAAADVDATERATLEAQLAKARSGVNFFEWRDGSFVVELPMSRADKDRTLRGMAMDLAGTTAELTQGSLERRNEAWGDASCAASLGSQLRRYEYEGGVVRLMFGEGGRVDLSARRGNVHYESKLLDRLVADKVPLDAERDDRRILADFEKSLAEANGQNR